MFNAGSGVSLADIAAVTGNRDGFGNGEGWWIIILLAVLFGWGNNGNGFGNCNNGVGAEIQRGFDNQTVMGSLRGLENGVCSLGYDQLNQMNGINTNIMQTGFNLQNAISMVAQQIANCCCENRQGQADLKYTMAKDTCDITNAIKDAAQQIINNDNNNYRQLHDENVALQIQGYQQQIADLKAMNSDLRLEKSQVAQSTDIVDRVIARLSSCPVGTYNVANPNWSNYAPWMRQGNGDCGCNGF